MKGIAPTIALVGNPNSGKTTLFNALTAQCAAVGNWAGVTVRQHECHCSLDEQVFKVVDLPGIYTLTYIEEEGSQDEKLTCHYLQENSIQAIINVIDVLKLERHLYLTLQCLEQNRPLIVVLNRLDLLETSLNLSYLSKVLGVPVIGISARESRGLKELKAHLKNLPKTVSAPPNIYPEIVEKQLKQLHEKLPAISRHQWLQWLEGQIVPQALIPLINQARQTIQAHLNEESDIVIAKARYKFIEKTLHELKQEKNNPHFSINLTQKLDNFFCHPFWGVPLFFGVMYLLFFWSIELGGIFQDFFELSANAFIHHSGAQIAHSFSITQSWWDILVQGLAQGVSTVFGFIPVLGMMFFGLAFLEDSGYMARSAFVMDRLMRAIGLPGKSLVPLLIGFGCNVGAVAGMRSLERKRERIVGIMMSPFMSCGARLAIFTVFVSAFFPHQGAGVILILYLVGILMALLTGWLLKKTILKGESASFLLEMPDYQWPLLRHLLPQTLKRLKRFLLNAAKLIVPICLVMSLLNEVNIQGKWKSENERSFLATSAQAITPLFKPMGIEKENWPAVVGLMSGVLAKEVVIGTLNALYVAPQNPASIGFIGVVKQAVGTIPANTRALFYPSSLQSEAFLNKALVSHFKTKTSAFAYLLFVLLYFPCISVTAAMVREVERYWTLFSIVWTTGMAYWIASLYYQLATFWAHPLRSLIVGLISGLMGYLIYQAAQVWARIYVKPHLPTPIILTHS